MLQRLRMPVLPALKDNLPVISGLLLLNLIFNIFGNASFKLSAQAGNAGFYLAGMRKDDLFKTVILDGALPRKTFSMGEAREKRYYMECRKIA